MINLTPRLLYTIFLKFHGSLHGNKATVFSFLEDLGFCTHEIGPGILLCGFTLSWAHPCSLQVNVALNYVEMSKHKKAQVRRTQQSKPLYVHSQDQ